MGQFDEFINAYFDQRLIDYYVRCWLVTIQSGGGVSYASEPNLRYRPYEGPIVASNDSRPYATGELNQTFDSREAGQYRFDHAQADILRVTVTPAMPSFSSAGGGPTEAYVRVDFESITWGGRFTLQGLTCRANVIVGYGPAIGREGEALYALALGTPFSIA